MSYVAWVILVITALVGIPGSVLPMLPGLPIFMVGVLIHKLVLPEVLSWWGVSILAALCVGSLFIDFIGTTYGAKRWGRASSSGLIGAAVGGVLGLLWPPFGLIVGPMVGALVGELFKLRALKDSLRSAIGAGIGFGFSTVLHISVSFLSLIVLIADLVW
ncbi:MAG: DUF456 domain-containing protein [Bdellovibrionales bacterium]|nr:DUF456 domain-containing protein [Bdellovibrionales bacterium]